MNKKDENMEWENEATYLAGLPRTMPYCVPDNYFDDLQLRIKQSVFIAGLAQKENQGFIVPEHYFDELSLQIQSKITTAQLKNLTDTSGFTTPPNYFDQLQTTILDKTSGTKPKVKIVKLWHTDLMRYASAACLFILVASGLYFNQQNMLKQARTVELATEHVLYDIDESTIIEHLQESQTLTNTSASDTEMENYILNNFSSSDLSNNL